MGFCIKCGHNLGPSPPKFCTSCGVSQPQSQTQSSNFSTVSIPVSMNRCNACRYDYGTQALPKFCTECGAATRGETSSSSSSATAAKSSGPPQRAPPSAPGASSISSQSRSTPTATHAPTITNNGNGTITISQPKMNVASTLRVDISREASPQTVAQYKNTSQPPNRQPPSVSHISQAHAHATAPNIAVNSFQPGRQAPIVQSTPSQPVRAAPTYTPQPVRAVSPSPSQPISRPSPTPTAPVHAAPSRPQPSYNAAPVAPERDEAPSAPPMAPSLSAPTAPPMAPALSAPAAPPMAPSLGAPSAPPMAPSFSASPSPAAPRPAASGDRAALLSSIQMGAKLKKTKTNDRSAPVVGREANSGGDGGSSGGGGGQPPSGGVGMGNIFAGGMPTLKKGIPVGGARR